MREPDSDFVHWLRWFDPDLRVRWNPQRQRWIIDEKNRQTKLWSTILTWEDDDGNMLPLNRDLALRLQLMRTKYNDILRVGLDDYLGDLNSRADFLKEQAVDHASMDAKHFIVDNHKLLKKLFIQEQEERAKQAKKRGVYAGY